MIIIPEKVMKYLINIKKKAMMSLKAYVSILVMAEIELIFFTVAVMGLCFGFVVETVLITYPT